MTTKFGIIIVRTLRDHCVLRGEHCKLNVAGYPRKSLKNRKK
jgi:hypothetical protein